MEYPYIKNITHEKVQSLAGLVNAEDGQIVSKTLAQNEAVSVTLFAFAKGEEISTHDSTGDAMVTVLEGTGRFTVDGAFIRLGKMKDTLHCLSSSEVHATYRIKGYHLSII